MRPPHILLASSNVRRMLENTRHILGPVAEKRLIAEINRNTVALFSLGVHHYRFASRINNRNWRQKASRLYYSVYNVRRSVAFHLEGTYNTDVSDHKNIGELPVGFPNINTYSIRLADMRSDRNLADYSHEATSGDLLIGLADSENLTADFIDDARTFLASRGVTV